MAKRTPSDATGAVARVGMRIRDLALGLRGKRENRVTPWQMPKPLPGVLPSASVAMDADPGLSALYGWAGNSYGGLSPYGGEGIAFFGWPVLSELAQRAEYRRMVSTLAQEMTRKWVRLTASGGDKGDKLARLSAEMKRFRLQDVFRKLAEHDGYFGCAHLLFDTGDQSPAEMSTPLTPTPEKLPRGGLKGIRAVEPVWCYPGQYNATNPLAPDFYKPEFWYVQGRQVHRTRLLTLVSREVPDMLRPAYMFGGISLTQLAKPYVDCWLRTRSSVGDLLESFTVWVLKTNLQGTLSGTSDGEELYQRADLFNNVKSSRGLMVLDKETEELSNVAVSLGGLHELQAQSQEHMASVDGMPLVKLLGITPSGLNATAEPELRSWHERVRSQQEHLFNDPLTRALELLQVHLFGEVDPDIGFEWEPLAEVDESQRATVRKTEADTASVLINAGVISPDEERARLANEEGSAYGHLDLNREIEPPSDDEDGEEDGDEGDEPAPDRSGGR